MTEPGTDLQFPLRVACVDMGSNAIRFVVAEFSSEREYVLLVNDRQPVRLGHGVYLSGRLNPQAMEAAVQAMVGFKAEMDRLGVVHARAVATSALRESSNRKDLIDAVRRETGARAPGHQRRRGGPPGPPGGGQPGAAG